MSPPRGAGPPAKAPAKKQEDMSLRERLALKANQHLLQPAKQPPRANPLYDDTRGMGKAISPMELSILKGGVGQRRRRVGDGSSDSGSDFFSEHRYGGLSGSGRGSVTSSRGAQQRPRGSPPAQAVPPRTLQQHNSSKSSAGSGARYQAKAAGTRPGVGGRAARQRRMIADSDSESDIEQSETPWEDDQW